MSQLSESIQAGGQNMKWFGVFTLVMGILALIAPFMTGISVVVLVGFFVVGGGIARMIWSFKSNSFGQGLLKFALGGLTLICGLFIVTDPLVSSGVLTIMIAIYLLVDGGFELMAAFTAPPPTGRGWLLFGGIISIVLGLMIWRQFPLSGAWALGIFLGVKLVMVGLAMMGIGRAVKKIA